MFGAFSSFCPNSLLKRRQEAASVFCVGAATRASVSAPHNRRNPLGSEVFAGPGCQWPVRRPPPPPPIPPKNSPPADPAPAAAAHIPAASTQRTLLGLGCSPPAGGRGPAGRPSWLELSIEPAQRPLPPSRLLTHRRRSSVRDTTARHTGCSENRRWQRGGFK